MTVATFCDDIIKLVVFILIGFYIRETIKPMQKPFLPTSLIVGLLLLVLGDQALNIVYVPESFSSLPSVLIDIVIASLVFGVNFNKKKSVHTLIIHVLQ